MEDLGDRTTDLGCRGSLFDLFPIGSLGLHRERVAFGCMGETKLIIACRQRVRSAPRQRLISTPETRGWLRSRSYGRPSASRRIATGSDRWLHRWSTPDRSWGSSSSRGLP